MPRGRRCQKVEGAARQANRMWKVEAQDLRCDKVVSLLRNFLLCTRTLLYLAVAGPSLADDSDGEKRVLLCLADGGDGVDRVAGTAGQCSMRDGRGEDKSNSLEFKADSGYCTRAADVSLRKKVTS